jgi:HAD superfamily hydrolase (TIGR01509 family)
VIKAVLWDVDGTLAETERDGHRVAFNQAFAVADVPWRWSEQRYGELLTVTGGLERLLYDMQFQTRAPADPEERQALAARLHQLKNEAYVRIVGSGALPLREGVGALMEDCERAGVRMGIVTTTGRANVDGLLRIQLGQNWEAKFAVVVAADAAPKRKPDPQAYLLALAALRLQPREALAIEDSPAGIAAAHGAGLPVIVTRSYYFPVADHSGVVPLGALAAGPSLARSDGWQPQAVAGTTRIGLKQINHWYAQSFGAR